MEKQEVITVKDGVFYRFHVEHYDHTSGFGDVSVGDKPVAYSFVQKEPDEGDHKFTVFIPAHLWSTEFEFGENSEMHRRAVAFGLHHAGEVAHFGSIDLDKVSLARMKARDAIQGTELRVQILKFFQTANLIKPSVMIPRDYVQYNAPGKPGDIDQHLHAFAEKGWLLGVKDESDVIDGNRIYYDIVYRVNPAKEDDVDTYIMNADIQSRVTSDGPLRAFISYSTKDKHLAGQIKTCLEKYGLSVFLAHEDLKISDEWMDRIIEELKSCHVFIPLLTDNYKGSEWTDQEAGYALAFDKKVCPLKGPHNPHGFIRRKQGEFVTESKVEPACEKIIAVIRDDEKLSPLLSKASSQENS